MIAVAIGVTAYAVANGNSPYNGIDYSSQDNWMYAEAEAEHEVDLFYIYPTIMMKSDRDDGCANITDEMKSTAKEAFAANGSAFAGYTNVFAPYYRQVATEKAYELDTYDNYYNFLKNSTGIKDLYAALDYYFEHYNNGRPFMFAGHSQGSGATLVILENYMNSHPELYKRMVAAYAIGFGVTQDYLDRNTYLKFATGATDTGVIISWNAEGIPADGVYKQSLVIGDNCQVINPLTWSRNTMYADKSMNKGELKVLDDGEITTVAGVNDAQINAKRGSLICTTNTDFTPTDIMGDVSLHGHDYSMYYRDIQINGFDRITAYLGHRPMTGTPMDYSDGDNWVCNGYTAGTGKQTADVFYLYPTCSAADTIVGDVDELMKYLAKSTVLMNVSAFAEYTNIYAPYYRQISSYGISQVSTADQFVDECAREVTRTDIYAALDYYFENYNEGRPFILAGHSQGSANLKNVLTEYMRMDGHRGYMDRMVAAYAIGFEFNETWLKENELTFASSATDTGVIISWNTYNDSEIAGDGSLFIGEGCVAINPLSWTRDTVKVDKSQNEGSFYVNQMDISDTIMYQYVASAQLSTVGGMLISSVDSDTKFETMDSAVLGKDSYHNYDWALFYDSIRENGQVRIAAYFAE